LLLSGGGDDASLSPSFAGHSLRYNTAKEIENKRVSSGKGKRGISLTEKANVTRKKRIISL